MTWLLAMVLSCALFDAPTVKVILVGDDMDPFADALIDRFANAAIELEVEHGEAFAPQHGPLPPGMLAEAWIIATPRSPIRIVVTDHSRGPAFTRDVDAAQGVGAVEVEEATLILYEAVASLEEPTAVPQDTPNESTATSRARVPRFGDGALVGGAVGVGAGDWSTAWQAAPSAAVEGGYLFTGPAGGHASALRLSVTGAVEYMQATRPIWGRRLAWLLVVPRVRLGGAGKHVWGFGTVGMRLGATIGRRDGIMRAGAAEIEPRIGGGFAVHVADHLIVGAEAEATVFPFFGPFVGGQITLRWVQRR